MKRLEKIFNRLKGLTDAMARYPLSVIFLVLAVVINAYAIESDTFNSFKYLMALGVGTILAASLQMVYEHFLEKGYIRLILMSLAAVITLGYYLIIRSTSEITMEISIKTGVAIFALVMFFIWVPSIKSRITFNESFLAAFKGFFTSLLFSLTMFFGVTLIVMATNLLLFTVDEKANIHGANIIFILFGIMYFLSLTPLFPPVKVKEKSKPSSGLTDQNKIKPAHHLQEEVDINTQNEPLSIQFMRKAIKCPKFLEILISYIIIPLTAVFTIILFLYILINIRGSFWEENLLEPMLVSYAVTVILVYILSSTLGNKFASIFRKVFPKVLLPIVLFQTIASVLKIGEMGITHGRYYVILFGIFAIIAGIVFSFLDVSKNGIIAAVLIVFSLISIIPTIDAFTVAKNNQMSILEDTLIKNGMLKDGKLTGDNSISDEDKSKITSSFQYLRQMDYTGDIEWHQYNDEYTDFHKIFGFDESETYINAEKYLYINTKENLNLNIQDYDLFATTNIGIKENSEICSFEKDGSKYYLKQSVTDGSVKMNLLNEDKQEIISFSMDKIEERFKNYSGGESLVDMDELIFSETNEKAEIKIITRDININKGKNFSEINATIFVFIDLK